MKAKLDGLTPAEVKALASLVSSDSASEASAALAVGSHPVDFTVRIAGSLDRRGDCNQRYVARAEPWLLLAVALSKLNGVTVESIVREALTADPKLVASLQKKADDAIGELKEATWKTRNGSVYAHLNVTRV
jgi:hypothetical protein